MADGHFATLISKDTDLNSITNPIAVQISDSTNSVTVDALNNGLNVNIVNTDFIVDDAAAIAGKKAALIALDDGTNSVFAQANGAGDLKVTLDTETVQISADASPNTAGNPIFVEVVSGGSAGTEVHDFDQAVAVAGGCLSEP